MHSKRSSQGLVPRALLRYVCILNDSTETLFYLKNLLSHPATTWGHVRAVDQMGCLNTIS